jgi:hypothetical protein
VASYGIRGELVATARAVGRGRARVRQSLLPRLKPSSGEAEFFPEGEAVPRRLHVPSVVIREQWSEWGNNVRYLWTCVIVVGESRRDHGTIILC